MDRPRTLFSDPTEPQVPIRRELPSSALYCLWQRLKAAWAGPDRKEHPAEFAVGGAGTPRSDGAARERPATIYDEAPVPVVIGDADLTRPGAMQKTIPPGDSRLVFFSPSPLREWQRMIPVLIDRIESDNPRVRVRAATLHPDARTVSLDVTVSP